MAHSLKVNRVRSPDIVMTWGRGVKREGREEREEVKRFLNRCIRMLEMVGINGYFYLPAFPL
jgi:hypothetical protein